MALDLCSSLVPKSPVDTYTPTGNYKSWTLDYIDPDLDQFWTDVLLTLPICQSEIVVKVPQALTKSS